MAYWNIDDSTTETPSGPNGWVAGVDMSQISIGVDRLNDVEMAVSAITGNLSFKVKQGD